MRKLKFIAIFACLFSLHLFGADMPKGDLNVTKIVSLTSYEPNTSSNLTTST